MSDENLYHQAAEELRSGTANPALEAKAFAKAEGDDRKVRAAYIELRVLQLKSEVALERGKKLRENFLKASIATAFGAALFFFVIYFEKREKESAAQLNAMVKPPPQNNPPPPERTYPAPTFSAKWTPEDESEFLVRRRALYSSTTMREEIKGILKAWGERLTMQREQVKSSEAIAAYNRERNAYARALQDD